MTTVDKTTASDAEFEDRIRPFEPNRDTYVWQVHEVPVPAHVHGAWCHPSADGCPDRPGM